ncbi:protein CHAPERONE-LIKE PROTEIN OF POR1, chloroplastic-like [Aristolochia californica]|uniref:protein CHAPERONE-LIKE PROTEIN OF POR1, chloroplastic-like n=1 Tax=Aristolochia californica TaxID=171875 RepID=UPI0035DB972B
MKEMSATLSLGPDRALLYRKPCCFADARSGPTSPRRAAVMAVPAPTAHRFWGFLLPPRRRAGYFSSLTTFAGSRADDSAPFEMSVENALKVLGVAEGASFDEILRAKNSILASCKDDHDTIAQVEAAYDMLLMQRLTQRRSGKVASSSVRYADVKARSGSSSLPQWLQTTVKNVPVSIETPSTGSLGIQAGVYGAMMALTYVNGASSGPYSGADVPGLILATSFGASLYFLSKKNISLGKGIVITAGGLVVGAIVGSAVENWLQVDVVPFLGIHSPAVVVSEFVLISEFLVSLYLR